MRTGPGPPLPAVLDKFLAGRCSRLRRDRVPLDRLKACLSRCSSLWVIWITVSPSVCIAFVGRFLKSAENNPRFRSLPARGFIAQLPNPVHVFVRDVRPVSAGFGSRSSFPATGQGVFVALSRRVPFLFFRNLEKINPHSSHERESTENSL